MLYSKATEVHPDPAIRQAECGSETVTQAYVYAHGMCQRLLVYVVMATLHVSEYN